MAEEIVSALASTIVGNLNSLVLQGLGTVAGVKAKLDGLKRTFSVMQAVLHDAEEKQWKSNVVEDWLRKLKDAAYDVQDVLDEFTLEAQRRQQQRDLKNRVRSFFSLDRNPLLFQVKMAHKLKDVREKLDAIAKERQNFHLREGVVEIEADSLDQRQTWSSVNESEIYGRGKQKEDLINMLLTSSDDFSIYAICGIGGLGKTTLAQLVYNDGRIKRHFDLQIWVCVSVDFNLKRLTIDIIESIEGRSPNIQQLDTLLRCLQEKLGGKKFLLILDDVWDDDHDSWNSLKDALSCGAKGSTVILTTRLGTVADNMATTPVQHMGTLSGDDSWLLFKQLAFGMTRTQDYAQLEKIGMEIVKKCGGVPLAIRVLGNLMSSKKNESEWSSVKESEVWDLPDENKILPVLRLSYQNLKPHLKQCFAFCSIFPKDHVMEKDRLVALWMANGFISCKGLMDLHDKGQEIFNELVGRLFFQEVKDNGLGNITCKMHDLIHDLAQSIMRHESCLIAGNTETEISETIRHLALDLTSHSTLNEKVLKARRLHSFLSLQELWRTSTWSDYFDLYFSRQKHLKALDVSNFSFDKLPKSICKLKHLRFLDVSHSSIKSLPESLTSLQNLQTLQLRGCTELIQLPKGMKHMKTLVYLDIRGCCSLRCMPAGMGQLTRLRMLGMFIVNEDNGNLIRELGRLNYLGNELRITDLGNVKNLTDAKSANLIGKPNLQSLTLSWHRNGVYLTSPEKETGWIGTDPTGSVVQENIEEVLAGLQPHSNLKELRIYGYGGSNFPNWKMNVNLTLPNVVDILLEWCGNCEQLPPFGKLQFLKRLVLRGMDGVKCIGSDVYGDVSYEENSFPRLETLHLDSMKSLVQWAHPVPGNHSFPRLREVEVTDCPMLIEIPIIPSLKTLIIRRVNATLLMSVRNLTSLNFLYISSIPNLMLLPDRLLQNHTLLEELLIYNMKNLQSLSNQILDNLSALKRLYISGCSELGSLPTNELCGLSSLRLLWVQYCDGFESLSEGVQYLTTMEDLLLSGCPKLNSLPESIQHLTSLQSLKISNCRGLSSLPDQIGYLTSLSRLKIWDCPNLMSLPDGVQSLSMLRELEIIKCPNLERRCEKERGEDWPKIAHIPRISYQ